MTTKELNSVTLNHNPVKDPSTKRLDKRLINTVVLFSKSELGDKVFTVLARVLGFGVIIGSLAFAAWGIISAAI